MEPLLTLQERLQTPWRSLNERDDVARMLWSAIKDDAGEDLSFSDCQRAVGGSIDAALAVAERLGHPWADFLRASIDDAIHMEIRRTQSINATAKAADVPACFLRRLVAALIDRATP